MDVKADISLIYDSKKQAKMIEHALKIDDGMFISSEIKDSTLLAHVESTKLSSFLQTIDDYLSCVSVAESVIKKSEKNK